MCVLEGGTSIKKESLTVWRQTVLLRCQPRSSSPSPSPQSSSSLHRLGEASESCFKWCSSTVWQIMANHHNPCSHMSRDTPFSGCCLKQDRPTPNNFKKCFGMKWNKLIHIQYCLQKCLVKLYCHFPKWMVSACRVLRSCRLWSCVIKVESVQRGSCTGLSLVHMTFYGETWPPLCVVYLKNTNHYITCCLCHFRGPAVP